MMGIRDEQGGKFKSKKMLKELCAAGGKVRFIETSFFGNEFKGAGEYVVVGPDPLERKWFASVKVNDDGLLLGVK